MSTATAPPLQLAAVAKSQAEVDRFEAALAAAGMLPNQDVEVIIATTNSDVRCALGPRSLIALEPGQSVFQLWAAAVQAGTATCVALMDAACPPTASWWEHARAAITQGQPVFYGPVVPGWPATDRRLAGYIIEYAQFNQPLHAPEGEYPGNNFVFQRALLTAQDFSADGLRKTFFVSRLLRETALRPHPVPAMAVRYAKSYEAAAYRRRRFAHGRAYGAQQCANAGLARFWYAARCVALPLLRTARIYRAIREDVNLRRSARALVLDITLSECAWSCGEAMGCAFGAGADARHLD